MPSRPRTAAFYCVYDDDEWLSCSISSIYSGVDAVYFFIARKPWNGPHTDNSKTLETIRSFADPIGKIRLICGDWADEVSQRNSALAELTIAGFEYAMIIDADEVYDEGAVARMLSYIAEHPSVGCWHCHFVVYWKSPGFRIDPPEKHHPPVFIKLGTGGFVEYRNCLSNSHDLMPAEAGFCHHLSYARTDEQIKRKIGSFSHSHQVRPNWYAEVWKRWDEDRNITDLCPYNPGVFERAVPVPFAALPAALRGALEKQSVI